MHDSSGLVCLCQSADVYMIAFYFNKKNSILCQRICRLQPSTSSKLSTKVMAVKAIKTEAGEEEFYENRSHFIIACNLRDSSVYAVAGIQYFI